MTLMSQLRCLPGQFTSFSVQDLHLSIDPPMMQPNRSFCLSVGSNWSAPEPFSLNTRLAHWSSSLAWVTVIILLVSCTWSLVYNLYFHPLAKYPGPFFAKTTPLYHLFHTKQKNLHLVLMDLHRNYGPIVRITPNRLCFESAKAYKDIYGQGKNLQKSSGYAPHPYYPLKYNLNNLIDRDEFAKKKRLVLQAFTEEVMRKMDGDLVSLAEGYCKTLGDQVVDMGTLTFCFGLDAVAIGVFGQTLNLLKDHSRRWILPALLEGNQFMYLRLVWPRLFNSWFAGAIKLSSLLFPTMQKMGQQFDEVCRETSENGTRKGALTTALCNATDPKTGDTLSEEEAWNEALLIVRAAGDTTSAALSSFFFYITRNADAYAALSTEIHSKFSSIDEIVPGPALSSCHYLRAALDEAMRLGPPAPASFWREISTGGARIDGTFVPSGFDVGVNLFGLHRNSHYHRKAREFRPERFLPSQLPNKVDCERQKSSSYSSDLTSSSFGSPAFSPFQIGPRSCPGKALAYREMTLFVARIFFLFHLLPANDIGAGAPGMGPGREDPSEFQIYDVFSSDKQGPYIELKRRTKPV